MNRSLVLLAATALFTVSALAANFDWPQWRGPDRDGVSKETGLLKSWPADGPKRIWLFESAGTGYSAPAIVAGKLFTMGTRDSSEIVLALDANTGKELWSASVGGIFNEKRGNGPRGTPTVTGNRVYAMSGMGNLACINVADGKIVWQQKMTDLGEKFPIGATPNPCWWMAIMLSAHRADQKAPSPRSTKRRERSRGAPLSSRMTRSIRRWCRPRSTARRNTFNSP